MILNSRLYGLRDSKLLTAKERGKLSKKIKRTCVWGIGEVTAGEIDKWQLTKATQTAFRRALKDLSCQIDYILADGFLVLLPIPCRQLKKP